MTRRGSFAYYSAAVVCGSFFVALTYYIHSAMEWGLDSRWAQDFLFAYFLAIIGGFVPLLLYGFVLRRITRMFHWQFAWQWALAGAIVGIALLWLMARLGYLAEGTYFSPERQRLKAFLVYPFVGAMMFTAKPFWLPIPVLVATAYVLLRIHRAFEPSAKPQ